MTLDRLDIADPWIALTAVALATEQLRLGAMVTPLARRRPWDVARQVAVLDRAVGRAHGLRRRPGRRQPARADRLRRGARPARSRGAARRGPRRDPRPVDRPAGQPRRPGLRARRGAGAPDAGAAAAPAGVAGLRVAPPPCRSVRAARYDGVFPVSHEASLTGADVRCHPRDRRRASRRRRRAVRPRGRQPRPPGRRSARRARRTRAPPGGCRASASARGCPTCATAAAAGPPQ